VEATGKPGKPVFKRVNCSGYFGHVRPTERAKVALMPLCTRGEELDGSPLGIGCDGV